MVFGNAIHALWTAKGLALKSCYGNHDASCRALLQAVNSYWNIAYNIGAVPGYVGAMVLIGLVFSAKSTYLGWTALTNPAVLALLSPLADRTPAPFGAILSGGFTNLSIPLFFFGLDSDDVGPFGKSQSSACRRLRILAHLSFSFLRLTEGCRLFIAHVRRSQL
jgi:hypothetical protein